MWRSLTAPPPPPPHTTPQTKKNNTQIPPLCHFTFELAAQLTFHPPSSKVGQHQIKFTPQPHPTRHRLLASPPSLWFSVSTHSAGGREGGRLAPHPAAVHLVLLPFLNGSEPTHLFTPQACTSAGQAPPLLLFHPSPPVSDTGRGWEKSVKAPSFEWNGVFCECLIARLYPNISL